MSQGRPNIDRLKRKRVIGELIRALRHDDVGVQLDAAKALNELDKERPLTWEPTDAHEHVLLILSRPGAVDEEGLASHAPEVIDTLAACLEHIAASRGSYWSHYLYEGRVGPLIRALVAADPGSTVELLIRLRDADLADLLGGDQVVALGDPRTVEPLLEDVRAGGGIKALLALEHVLEKSVHEVPTDVLESVAALENEDVWQPAFSMDLTKGTRLDAQKAWRLAQEELAQRDPHDQTRYQALVEEREERERARQEGPVGRRGPLP